MENDIDYKKRIQNRFRQAFDFLNMYKNVNTEEDLDKISKALSEMSDKIEGDSLAEDLFTAVIKELERRYLVG